mgnify:CR=1 FL=1
MKNTKISRRSFLLGLAACSAAGVLTACSGSSEPASSASTAPEAPASSAASEVTAAPFLTVEDFPALDGSTACIPLMAQMKADVTGMDLLEAQTSITVSTTAYAWENFGLWSRSDSEDYGAQLLIVYEAPEYVKEELAEADAKLEQKAIGRDALVFIVNEENPVQSLTQQQLRDIYAGRITNWKDVGGADASISLYVREDGSGTRETFEERALDKGSSAAGANVVNSNGAMKTAIAQDPNAVGYVGIGHLDKSIRGLSVDGMKPSQENAANGSYTVTRLLYMNTKGEPQGLTRAFVDYIYSPAGKEIVAKAGYIPYEKK